MNQLDSLRSFGMANLFIYHELERLEQEFQVQLRPNGPKVEGRAASYFSRFESELRRDATVMARHYEVFYCLENSIRGFISDLMEAAFGVDWWAGKVDQEIRAEAGKNRAREDEMGMEPRSEQMIDYVTFGQLSQIIEKNWEVFAGALRNRAAVVRVMKSLNTLRGPIAHCNPLPEDEVARLQLALRDWFRQLEE